MIDMTAIWRAARLIKASQSQRNDYSQRQYVDINDLLEWCRGSNFANDGQALPGVVVISPSMSDTDSAAVCRHTLPSCPLHRASVVWDGSAIRRPRYAHTESPGVRPETWKQPATTPGGIGCAATIGNTALTGESHVPSCWG